MFAHMLPCQVTAKYPGWGPVLGLPLRSVVTRLARLRTMAISLMAGAPPQRSMSQLDCQPPELECCVLGWDFSRCSITRRSSPLSVAACGTSRTTSGVANCGTISGDALLISQPNPDKTWQVCLLTHATHSGAKRECKSVGRQCG